MKIVAFNGGARKQGNTAQVLEQVLAGAAVAGAETELISLFDYNYTSCRGCLGCKRLENKGKGICIIPDDFQLLIHKAKEADAIVLGSPVYVWDVTGQFRSFFERMVYAAMEYTTEGLRIWPKKVPAAFVYTCGAPVTPAMDEALRNSVAKPMEQLFKMAPEVLAVDGSFVFQNTEAYYAPRFAQNHTMHYGPTEAQAKQAYALGKSLAEKCLRASAE